MNYTRIYADDGGTSRFEDQEVLLTDAGTIVKLSSLQAGRGVIFRETEDTYDYDWHPAPRKQWIILLNGEISIETGDGVVRRFAAGDVLLVEDTHGRGHKTRQLSSGVRRSLFIPID